MLKAKTRKISNLGVSKKLVSVMLCATSIVSTLGTASVAVVSANGPEDSASISCELGKAGNTYAEHEKELEELSKKAEDFARSILEAEAKEGRDLNELVDMKEIDRLLYKYTPGATDKPNVVSKEEFDEMTKDGRLVLYRGNLPLDDRYDNLISSVEEVNNDFRYGDFYYPCELNGVYCTKSVEHAKTYAKAQRSWHSGKMLPDGSVLQFCFTDTSPDALKIITSKELEEIRRFYAASHSEYVSEFMESYGRCKFRLESGIMALGSETVQFSFMARALGYDLIDNEYDEWGGDGCPSDVFTSQLEVLNRGKLTVCSEDISVK